jgi:hypothetical protein
MANLESIVQQLKQERDRIDQAIRTLTSLNGNVTGRTAGTRTMSAAARAQISRAQKARWAKSKGSQPVASNSKRGSISAAGRRRIAAAQKARWAKLKAAKK